MLSNFKQQSCIKNYFSSVITIHFCLGKLRPGTIEHTKTPATEDQENFKGVLFELHC